MSEAWSRRTLSTRFVIVSTLVILATMLHIGVWVDARIRHGVVQNAAFASARYIDHAFAPLLQDLATSNTLSAGDRRRLETTIRSSELGRSAFELKIWLPNGALAYSLLGATVAPEHKPGGHVLSAFANKVTAEFENADDLPLAASEKQDAVFEVYAPIRATGSDRVIAVAEFYEDATPLRQEFTIAAQQSWIVVGSLTLGMLSLLFTIVHRASLQLVDQKKVLEDRLSELRTLLGQNDRLRQKLQAAQQTSHALADEHLRRIGADLHDGPAQLIGYSLLRLHALEASTADPAETARRKDILQSIETATRDALNEIRGISSGISLPALEALSPRETIELAVAHHERRSGTVVAVELGQLPAKLSLAARTCIYRCIQESLNNAWRHAGGVGQRVAADYDGRVFDLMISDEGPGFDASAVSAAIRNAGASSGLGLAGLRHRVEALNGALEISAQPGRGATVHVTFPEIS